MRGDENRRRHYRESFDMLLGIAVGIRPFNYWSPTGLAPKRQGVSAT